MTEQLWAVILREDPNDDPQIVRVFSRENFAMTHMAKLRVLPNRSSRVYTVEPLAVDEGLDEEVAYYAYCTIGLEELVFDAGDVEIYPEELRTTLPDFDITVRTAEGYVELMEYSWSPEDAMIRLRQLAEAFIIKRKQHIEDQRIAGLGGAETNLIARKLLAQMRGKASKLSKAKP